MRTENYDFREKLNRVIAGATLVSLGMLAMFSGHASAQEAPSPQAQTEFAQSGGEAGEGGVARYEGDDRFETAVEISRNRFADGEANTAFIIHEQGFDATAIGPASAAYNGTVLYTRADELPQITVSELLRTVEVQENVEQVFIIGGIAVVSEEIEQDIQDMGYTTRRIAGSARDVTATEIAEQLIFSQNSIGTPSFFVGDVYEQRQEGALAAIAGSRFHLGDAANGYGVVLPANDGELSPHTISFYNQYADRVDATYAIGASAVAAVRAVNIEAEEIFGNNDTATSVELAERFNIGDGYTPGVALSATVADTLTSTAHATSYIPGEKNPAWLMYTTTNRLSPGIVEYITDRQNTPFAITDGFVYGGTAAVSNATSEHLAELIAQ